MTAIPASMLGVALLAGTTACNPEDGGGGKSAAEICTDLDDQLPPLVAAVVSSPLSLGFYPGGLDGMTADQKAQVLDTTHASYTSVSTALRGESDLADDPDTASALTDTAGDVDAQSSKIKTVYDVHDMNSGSVDVSRLYPRCPELKGALDG